MGSVNGTYGALKMHPTQGVDEEIRETHRQEICMGSSAPQMRRPLPTPKDEPQARDPGKDSSNPNSGPGRAANAAARGGTALVITLAGSSSSHRG